MDKMNQRPLILVTNDDGIYAGGMEALISVARMLGDVIAISSKEPMSGMSHAITIKVPLRVKLVSNEAGFTRYLTNGTPVDGVKLVSTIRIQILSWRVPIYGNPVGHVISKRMKVALWYRSSRNYPLVV